MKCSFLKLSVFVLALITFSACNNGVVNTETSNFNLDSVKAQIAASNIAFAESWASGDSTKFTNCYTSDAVVYAPNMPAMSGAASLNGFFNEGFKWGIRNIPLKTTEVFGNKDIVVETGTYELFLENNVSGDKGKYIVMWKEENGKWKMYRDVWNSDTPMPPPATK